VHLAQHLWTEEVCVIKMLSKAMSISENNVRSDLQAGQLLPGAAFSSIISACTS